MSIQLGDTYYFPGGHLWIVISDPSQENCVVVNLTTDEFRAGKECEFAPGDHSWITKRTFVSFGDAQLLGPEPIKNLEKNIAMGVIKTHSPFRDPNLAKIIAAGKISKALSQNKKALL